MDLGTFFVATDEHLAGHHDFALQAELLRGFSGTCHHRAITGSRRSTAETYVAWASALTAAGIG